MSMELSLFLLPIILSDKFNGHTSISWNLPFGKGSGDGKGYDLFGIMLSLIHNSVRKALNSILPGPLFEEIRDEISRNFASAQAAKITACRQVDEGNFRLFIFGNSCR